MKFELGLFWYGLDSEQPRILPGGGALGVRPRIYRWFGAGSCARPPVRLLIDSGGRRRPRTPGQHNSSSSSTVVLMKMRVRGERARLGRYIFRTSFREERSHSRVGHPPQKPPVSCIQVCHYWISKLFVKC